MTDRETSIKAGYRAINSLEKAKEELNNAKSWGLFDIFGGGLISSVAKHSRMERAESYIVDAQDSLEDFNDSLTGLSLQQINLDTDDLLGVLDIFLDGLLVDWMLQSRIKEASEAVDKALYELRRIIIKLENFDEKD